MPTESRTVRWILRGLAFAVARDDVDHAHFVQRLGRQHPAGHDQLLGGTHSDAPGEQAVRTHAREQVEQDLRKAELRTFFGNDDVRGQCGLEAAAEGVTLHERDGRQAAAVEILDSRVQIVDAKAGIVRQRVAIARFDQQDEQRQVAAQVENARGARTEHVNVRLVRNPGDVDLAIVCRKRAVMRMDVLQQSETEAGIPFWIEITPDRAGGRLEFGLELTVDFAVLQSWSEDIAHVAHVALPIAETKKMPSVKVRATPLRDSQSESLLRAYGN